MGAGDSEKEILTHGELCGILSAHDERLPDFMLQPILAHLRARRGSRPCRGSAFLSKGDFQLSKKTERPVVVTTSHRGVFFGFADDTSGETITLKRARMAVYWSSDVKGVMGLASKGPSSGCKIGDAVPEIELRDIAAVIACTDEAVKAWESNTWNP
jgi:hypothetical protein